MYRHKPSLWIQRYESEYNDNALLCSAVSFDMFCKIRSEFDRSTESITPQCKVSNLSATYGVQRLNTAATG